MSNWFMSNSLRILIPEIISSLIKLVTVSGLPLS